MTTTKKRSHKNNKARLTATERVDALLSRFPGFTFGVADEYTARLRRAMIRMTSAHAAATLDRKKRRTK